MREQDDRGKITFAYKRGKEEMAEKARQREEELTKEFRRKKEENAERNLNLGVSIEDIVKATGLTAEEVKKLKDKK